LPFRQEKQKINAEAAEAAEAAEEAEVAERDHSTAKILCGLCCLRALCVEAFRL